MANSEHLAKLKEAVNAWNYWRRENPEIKPDLSNANLELDYLRDFNLIGANLNGANLKNASLLDADLSSADLSDADLSGANLSSANLENVNFKNANLKDANLENTNLQNANFKSANLESANLKDSNLNKAKLYSANLRDANLQGSKLYDAKLYGANLRYVNLKSAYLRRVGALSTNFEDATFTGACIEDWNINSETNLKNVTCDCIYLKVDYYLVEEDKYLFEDRRPHNPNKQFAPGEFAKLFQKALETVDLIFSEGIEWAAFLESFQQLQAEIKSEELSIQAIEKKSGGAFIVRIEVPPEANKADIQKYIEREYEARLKVIEASYQKQLQAKDEEIIKAYREKSNDLLEVVKTMSSIKQTTNINNNPTMSTGNTYNTEKAGIVHNEGEIKDNTKVAAIINEYCNQDLAAAAKEIQQLLDQLAQNNPTETLPEQMVVGAKAIAEIEKDTTLKQRIINALKAMTVETFMEAIKHPLANVLRAGIEAYREP